MLSSQYILMSFLCLYGFIRGAASREVQLVRYSERLQFSDCFTQTVMRVPGKQRFYVPIVFAKSFDVNVAGRFFGGHPKKIRGVLGFVEGKDEVLTKRAAELILASLPTWSKDDLRGELDTTTAVRTIEIKKCKKYIQLVTQDRIELLQYILKTECFLEPVESSYPRLLRSLDTGLALDKHHVKYPSFVARKKAKVCRCLDLEAHGGWIQGLATYAATLSVSHEAPFLQFNLERYGQFLQQEFDAQTILKQ